MKKSIYCFNLFCMISMFTLTSCEKSIDQAKVNDKDRIVYRSCPNGGDCACSVRFKNANSSGPVVITIYGTTDGNAAQCSETNPPVTCEIIDGLSHSGIQLDIDYPKHLFCMETEHGYRVDIMTMTGPDTLIFTCQEGTLPADTSMVIVNSPGRRVYFRTTTECGVPRCL